MSYKCQLSGVSRQNGNRVSHANNKSAHVFRANLQSKRFFLPSEKRWVRLRVSSRMIRTIDKLGIEVALEKYGLNSAVL